MQKTIIWTKKNGKGQQESHKACELMKVLPQKLKTRVKTLFASKVVLFQEAFEFKHVIVFHYGSQQLLVLHGHVHTPQVWAIAQVRIKTYGLKVVVDTFKPMV